MTAHRAGIGRYSEAATPLIAAPHLAAALGCRRLLIKDEGQNPTGSFKDRSASWTIARLLERAVTGVVLHSTGNAGAAFATYAARAGMACVSIVPSDVLDANVEQMRKAGARIITLASWTDAARRAAEEAAALGYTDVSTGRTVFRAEGKQTLAVEIVEQLGERFPDVVICPTGGGTAVLALHAAFDALEEAGIAGTPPRLFISQYSGCAPLVAAHRAGEDSVRPWANVVTPRGGMRTAAPIMGGAVLAAIRNGGAWAVDPRDAFASARALNDADGIAVGLEGATGLAAATLALRAGEISGDATIVIINTAAPFKSDPAWRMAGVPDLGVGKTL